MRDGSVAVEVVVYFFGKVLEGTSREILRDGRRNPPRQADQTES